MLKSKGEVPGAMSPEEVKRFVEWAWEAYPRTTFDSNIITFPRCVILFVEDDKGTLAYCPMQTTLMAEAFIPRPEASNYKKAASLGKFDEVLCGMAKRMQISQIYTYIPCTELGYIKRVKNHGWEEVENVRIFRKDTGLKKSRG